MSRRCRKKAAAWGRSVALLVQQYLDRGMSLGWLRAGVSQLANQLEDTNHHR